MLSTQPIYHIGGSCAAVPTPISRGCMMVIPKFYEAGRVMQLIERERCMSRTGMPAMFIMEMNHSNFDKYDLSSLKTASCTGTAEMREKIRGRMGIDYIISVFSSTEAGGTHGDWRDPWEVRAEICGRPYLGVELQIRDSETGRVLRPGEAGEIFISGWWTMNGYFKQPELSRADARLARTGISPSNRIIYHQEKTMAERVAFRMRVHPDKIAEYKKRHDEIWPEMIVALKAAGVSDYSIWHDPETNYLFATLIREDDHTMADLPRTDANRRWWDFMTDVMDYNADGTPTVVDLVQVFHMP